MWPRWGAIGHDFILTLQASDCPYSGHAGYTYLDAIGPGAGASGLDAPQATRLIVPAQGETAASGRRFLWYYNIPLTQLWHRGPTKHFHPSQKGRN